MASDIFAKIGDIKGESADSKHKGEIDILSFSWGVTNSGTSAAAVVAAGPARPRSTIFRSCTASTRRRRCC